MDAIGSSASTSIVTVNNQSTYRKSDYFRKDLALDNSSAPVYAGITNIAVLNNGTNADTVTNITGNLFLSKATEAFAYDADGNMTNDGRWYFVWDAENRLVTITNNANVPTDAKKKLEFAYDWQGRRISKVGCDWAGSSYTPVATNKFIYDRWNLKLEVDHTNGVLRTYTCGTDVSGTSDRAGGVGGLRILKIGTNSTTYFPAYDGNGNVVNFMNAADASIAATFEYSPFGEAIRSEGTTARANPVRFSSKYTDLELDFAYYGYRYYNPAIGRWLSRDLIEERGGPNLFAFVRNDSIKSVDALGLSSSYSDPYNYYDLFVEPGLRLQINSFSDALAHYRSGYGGTVAAGNGLYDEMIADSTYKERVKSENGWVASRIKEKLAQVPYLQMSGIISAAPGSRVGQLSSKTLGSYGLSIRYEAPWKATPWRTGFRSFFTGRCYREVSSTVRVDFELLTDWNFQPNRNYSWFKNLTGETIPGWIAGARGTPADFMISGSLSETYNLTVEQSR